MRAKVNLLPDDIKFEVVQEYLSGGFTQQDLMDKYNIKANKNLGQNFLVDENVIETAIEKSNINEDDLIELKNLDNSMAQKRFEAMGNRDAAVIEAQGLAKSREIQGYNWQQEQQFNVSKAFAENEGFATAATSMFSPLNLVGIARFISSSTERIASVKPTPNPRPIFSPIPANTVEGLWIPSTFFAPLITLRNRLPILSWIH